jgi:hypothetical protein
MVGNPSSFDPQALPLIPRHMRPTWRCCKPCRQPCFLEDMVTGRKKLRFPRYVPALLFDHTNGGRIQRILVLCVPFSLPGLTTRILVKSGLAIQYLFRDFLPVPTIMSAAGARQRRDAPPLVRLSTIPFSLFLYHNILYREDGTFLIWPACVHTSEISACLSLFSVSLCQCPCVALSWGTQPFMPIACVGIQTSLGE